MQMPACGSTRTCRFSPPALLNRRRPSPAFHGTQEIGEQLENVIPDNLTPKDALEMLYQLKALLPGSGGKG